MKKAIVGLVAICSLMACKKELTTTTAANKITVHFNALGNGSPLEIGAKPLAANSKGLKFSANSLKFYINNIRLIDDKGFETTLKQYDLIDFEPVVKNVDIDFGSLPKGKYSKLIFNFGVDSNTNKDVAHQGALDPINGMFWAWTGYSFLQHEGRFIDSLGVERNLLFHYGANNVYMPNVEFDLKGMELGDAAKEINVNLLVDKIYNDIDFHQYNNMMSEQQDEAIMLRLSGNLRSAFALGSIK